MVDHLVTISNTLTLLGAADTNKWDAYNWGSFNWGEGSVDLETHFTKFLEDSITLDSAVSAEAAFVVNISETLTLSGDLGSQQLQDAAGYSYVFPDRTTEGEDRDFTTWTAGTASSSVWTSAAATSTTWSES